MDKKQMFLLLYLVLSNFLFTIVFNFAVCGGGKLCQKSHCVVKLFPFCKY